MMGFWRLILLVNHPLLVWQTISSGSCRWLSFSNCESPSFVAPQDSLPFLINGGMAGFQSSNDLLINITGFTGTLPALGSIPVGNFFV
jgi:hypothetical protein